MDFSAPEFTNGVAFDLAYEGSAVKIGKITTIKLVVIPNLSQARFRSKKGL